MSATVSIADRAPWLFDEALQRLLAVLSADGEDAYVVGGAVRNTLLGQPVTDIDIATTTVPDITIRRAAAAGFKAVPTGIAHGTVTLVSEGRAYEATTMRADIETDGRHAKVRFGRDLLADAERRDFTINALYAQSDGTVIDLVGGLDDIVSRSIRFIGTAEDRIAEDRLRILRFFRFFAWYGGGRPDAEGLRACVRLKGGLSALSAERVWSELFKTLSAPDPSRAMLWMRQAGVLTQVLPESERWGIDAIHALIGTERAFGWTLDPLLRLEAIVPPDPIRMGELARRLKLSRADADRLIEWADSAPIEADLDEKALRRRLFREKPAALRDRLRLSLVSARGRAVTDDSALVEAARLSRLLDVAEVWQPPSLPVRGSDLQTLGLAPGPSLGRTLRRLEQLWIESDFTLDRDALMARAAENPAGDRPARPD